MLKHQNLRVHSWEHSSKLHSPTRLDDRRGRAGAVDAAVIIFQPAVGVKLGR